MVNVKFFSILAPFSLAVINYLVMLEERIRVKLYEIKFVIVETNFRGNESSRFSKSNNCS